MRLRHDDNQLVCFQSSWILARDFSRPEMYKQIESFGAIRGSLKHHHHRLNQKTNCKHAASKQFSRLARFTPSPECGRVVFSLRAWLWGRTSRVSRSLRLGDCGLETGGSLGLNWISLASRNKIKLIASQRIDRMSMRLNLRFLNPHDLWESLEAPTALASIAVVVDLLRRWNSLYHNYWFQAQRRASKCNRKASVECREASGRSLSPKPRWDSSRLA